MRKKLIITLVVALAIIFLTLLLGRGGKTELMKEGGNNESAAAVQREENEKVQIEEYRQKYSLDDKGVKYDDFMIQAKSGIVVDAQTGKILYAKDEHKRLAPASITKIMTAIVALENMDPGKRIAISRKASLMEPFKVGMNIGEKIKAEDLLYASMMISANDAAEALAEGFDGGADVCIDKMNEKARLLEMQETSFRNSCGLDAAGHTSSAYDMAKLAYYGLRTHPELIKYMGEKKPYSIPKTKENEAHYWYGHVSTTINTYPEVIGAKTGFTDNAGNTFVGIAQKKGKKFIFVFMGSDHGNEDAKALLDLGLSKM